MSLQLQSAWRHDGSPFILATPVQTMVATMIGHGYTVYFYPDDAHQVATPAEDHCPYSETPWPGDQPYPHGMAADVMPHSDPRMPTLAQIGAQVVADKQAGVAGVAWLKYMNWTDGSGRVRHTSWQPDYADRSSSDSGHIHWSCRTDFVTSNVATGYDPVARILGVDDMTPEQWTLIEDSIGRGQAIFDDTDTIEWTQAPSHGRVNKNKLRLNGLQSQLSAQAVEIASLKAMVAALQPGGPAQLVAHVHEPNGPTGPAVPTGS